MNNQQSPSTASDSSSHHDSNNLADSAVLGVGFGQVQYSIEERQFLQNELEQKLDQDMIAKRDGPSGSKVHYIETWKAIAQTNRLFGFNGWSSKIMEINLDFIDQVNGRFTAGVSAIVRITLKDGSFREDIGYGISENQKQKGKALEQGKKKAVSDALKRALKAFGHALGLSVYDKDHLKEVERTSRLKSLKGNNNNNSNGPSDDAKAKNPHFNQTPGSPPKNSFAPSAGIATNINTMTSAGNAPKLTRAVQGPKEEPQTPQENHTPQQQNTPVQPSPPVVQRSFQSVPKPNQVGSSPQQQNTPPQQVRSFAPQQINSGSPNGNGSHHPQQAQPQQTKSFAPQQTTATAQVGQSVGNFPKPSFTQTAGPVGQQQQGIKRPLNTMPTNNGFVNKRPKLD